MRNFLCIVCIVIKSSWTTTKQMNADDFPPRTQLQVIDGPYNGGSKPFSADRKIHLLETKTTACCLQKPRWHPLFFCGALRAIGFLSLDIQNTCYGLVFGPQKKHLKHIKWGGMIGCLGDDATRFDPLHLWMVNGIATSHLDFLQLWV